MNDKLKVEYNFQGLTTMFLFTLDKDGTGLEVLQKALQTPLMNNKKCLQMSVISANALGGKYTPFQSLRMPHTYKS
jgi:hypothetical protein